MNYFSHYLREPQTKLFNECGAFFAFSNEQYEEQAKEGVQYVCIMAGLLCPKDNADKLNEGLDRITEEAVKADVAENTAEGIMRREYFNHECQISCDPEDAIASLYNHRKVFPELFTDEVMNKVFTKCFNDAVKNDWF